MYIKSVVKKNRGSKKSYEYLHLVESIRTKKGPRQRLVLNLGTIDIPKEKHKELANCVAALLSDQKPLFCPDPVIEKHAQKAVRSILKKRSVDAAMGKASETQTQNDQPQFRHVDVNSLDAGQVRSVGPEYVCHSVWNELGISNVLLSNGLPKHTVSLAETLVIGRLVDPGSERHTHSWAENRSAVYELTGNPPNRSLNAFYRTADALFKCKEALETHLSAREKEIFSLPEQLCFFDLTNTFVEGQALANSKAKRGRSKEKRSDCKLLTLALIIDEQGFAKYSQLYSGNRSECKTLAEMIESLIEIRPDLSKDRTVIMDAGIATKDNIDYLKQKQMHYIVVNRGKGEFTPDDINDMRVVFRDDDRNLKLEVKRDQKDGEVRLLCRSSGRREKETGMRGRQETRFLEGLESVRDGLDRKGCTKRYDKVPEKVGRLREKYPKASKVYNITVTPDGDQLNPKIKTKDIVWEKRDLYDAQVKFEGCYVLRTDHIRMSDEEIRKTYVMLTRIERAFRCLKTDLGLRPIFHQLETRSDSHMFISVPAYHILHVIESRLRTHGDHRAWGTIREMLSTHQRLTIEYDYKEQEEIRRAYIRVCSLPERDHRIIYHRVGVSDLPLRRQQKIENL
jgi:transposase